MIEEALEPSVRTIAEPAMPASYLERTPDDVDGLHYLGLLCHQTGRSGEAVRLIGRAVERSPTRRSARQFRRSPAHARGSSRGRAPCARRVQLEPEQANFNSTSPGAGRAAGLRRRWKRGSAHCLRPDWVEALTLNASLASRSSGWTTQSNTAGARRCSAPMIRAADRLDALPRLGLRLAGRDASGTAAGDAGALVGAAGMRLRGVIVCRFEYPFRGSCATGHASLLRAHTETAGAPCKAPLPRGEGARLRVGYVSRIPQPSDHAPDAQLFALHDRSRYEVYAYSIARTTARVSPRGRDSVEHFVTSAPKLRARAPNASLRTASTS